MTEIEGEGGLGTMSANMVLLTTAARLRAGPYPIELQPGDMIKDGERVVNVTATVAINSAEDAEELLKT